MKDKFYKISKKDGCWTAVLSYGETKFHFRCDPGIRHIKQIGIAILGKHGDRKYSLYLPVEFKGFNSKANLMYRVIGNIVNVQYYFGLFLITTDNYHHHVINIDEYAMEYRRIMGEYMRGNECADTKYLEKLVSALQRNSIINFAYIPMNSRPYIKGKYPKKDCFILSKNGADYMLSPNKIIGFNFSAYNMIHALGETEYLIPQSLVKITTLGGEYIVSKDEKSSYYDTIFEIKGCSFLEKLRPIFPFITEYKVYGFMNSGKFSKISIYSLKDAKLSYELSFEGLGEAVNFSTIRLIKSVRFSCARVDIWSIQAFSGRTFIIMKHNDEQRTIGEL